MSEQEAYPLEPEHIQAALALRLRTRRLAHLGQWPTHAMVALGVLLFAVLNQILRQSLVPEVEAVAGIILILEMGLIFGLSFLLRRVADKLRHAFHLDSWPKPGGFSFRTFVVTGVIAFALSYLLIRLGIQDPFFLLIPLWLGLYQVAAAMETRVEYYAVGGSALLLGSAILMAWPYDPIWHGVLLLLALAEALAAVWGWWEWHRFQHEAVDVR